MSESVDAYRGGSGRWDSRLRHRAGVVRHAILGGEHKRVVLVGAHPMRCVRPWLSRCASSTPNGPPASSTTRSSPLFRCGSWAIDAGLRPVRLHEPSVLGPSPSKDAPAFRGSASPYVLTSRSSRLAASSTRPNKVPGFLHRHPTGLAEPETSQAARMQQQSSPRRRPTISRWNAQPQRPTSAAPAA
jgi:hypothetical protein